MSKLKIEIGGGAHPRPGFEQFESDGGFNIITDEIPYENNSIDVVYMSHIIEHIPFYCAPNVLIKIHKKLKPGGYLRVVCPDLEQIIEAYIKKDYLAFPAYKHEIFIDPDGLLPPIESASGGSLRNKWGGIHPLNVKLGIGGLFLNQICSQAPNGTGDLDIYSGGQKVSSQSHISAYDFEMMHNLLKYVGFSKIDRTEITSFDTWNKPGQLAVNARK